MLDQDVRIVIESFGAATLIAEYDAERKTIRLNARILASMRARFGEAAAQELLLCALAHEYRHALYSNASEEEAHAYARLVTGCDPRRLERMVAQSLGMP